MQRPSDQAENWWEVTKRNRDRVNRITRDQERKEEVAKAQEVVEGVRGQIRQAEDKLAEAKCNHDQIGVEMWKSQLTELRDEYIAVLFRPRSGRPGSGGR